jgi:ornithine carbamoyltransferase
MTETTPKRDFLTLTDLTLAEHEALYTRAVQLKADRRGGKVHTTLAGKTLACVFEKASTRTRLSFEAAMAQLGGTAIVLDAANSQIARGEPARDTARVTSSYVDGIMYRTFGDDRLHAFAAASRVPVINGLSDGGHPVQLLADLMTVRERLGSLTGRVVAWVGDGASNMARSWVEAAMLFGFELRIAAPSGFRIPPAEQVAAKARVSWTDSPVDAVRGADVVNTDVWTSMGQEGESAVRQDAFAGYCITRALLAGAANGAIVLHCLPAHRGEEIAADVIDDEALGAPIFDQAENRMHVQKALLEHLLRARRLGSSF